MTGDIVSVDQRSCIQGRIQRGAQGARALPLISRVVIFNSIISYKINPPVSGRLMAAPAQLNIYPFP